MQMEYLQSPYNLKGSTFATKKCQYFTEVIYSLKSSGVLGTLRGLAGCLDSKYRSMESECFGLEGTFNGHLAQPPCSEQGHLQLHQVAQSLIQPDLACFQGWGTYHLSGKPVPVFHHRHCKKFLPYI